MYPTRPLHASVLLALGALAAAQGNVAAPAGGEAFATGSARVRVDRDGHATISRDGGRSFARLPEHDGQLRLRHGTFDPRLHTPRLPADLGAPANARLFVVQGKTALVPEYRDALLIDGLEVVGYLPGDAWLVRGDRAARARAQQRAWVRWVGDLPAGYKIDPLLVDARTALAGAPGATFDCVLQLCNARERAALVARLQALGVVVPPSPDRSRYLRAPLTPAQLAAVAADDRVLWIERATAVTVDVDNARIQGGANTVETLTGINGQGVRVEISEGLDNSHPDWTLPPLVRYDGLEAHGHCTAAIIGCSGAGNAAARGIAPGAQLIESSVFNWLFANVSRYQLIQGSVNPALPWQAMQQTASWGNTQTFAYTTYSAELDDAVFDFDLPITQSMGNTGAQSARPQAWAKNVLSIGSVYHWNTATNADDQWTDGSIGPAPDGRIKPDLVAYGDNVACGDIAGAGGYDPGNYFASFSGTSSATPIVGGYLALTQQMFTSGWFHNALPLPPTAASRFANRPHASTARALLLGTAAPYAFSGLGHNLTRTHQGWGFPDVAVMYGNRDRSLVLDEYDLLTQGQERQYLVYVKPGQTQLRATLVWTDPPAAPNAAVARVNDLDLRVTDLDGTTVWWGNYGLDVGNASQPGGVRDDKNTVEQVWLQNPVGGIYKVIVSAPQIVQDGHVETPQLDADYALVVSPLGGGYNDHDDLVLTMTSNASGDLRLQTGNLPATGWNEGFTFFSFDATGPLGFGQFFGMRADSLTGAIYSLPVRPDDVFHFANQGAASWPNKPFAFPPAIAQALRGLTVDAMVTLLQNGAVAAQSNVARVQIQ